MNALLSQAADLRAQAHTLAEQALFGDLFADTSAETIAQLNAQADALEAQAAVVAPAPAQVTFEKSAQGATSNEAHSEIWLNGERVGRLTTLKWGGVAITYTVEIFSVNYRNPQPFHVEDHKHARAALAAARRYATDLLTAPAPAVNDDVEVEPSPAEQLDAIFEELLSPVSEPVGEPADMDLIETAFDQHWRHDGGACMIELSEFKAHQPRDLDAYTFNGSLYYSDGSLAWSIALEYLD